MKKSFFIILTVFCGLILSTTFQSCYNDSEEELYGTPTLGTCDTSNVKYSAFVSPLITTNCATSGCHNASTASAGANLSTYATTKSYITNAKAFFLGSIKHTTGFSQMPKSASKMAACDIAKIEVWINAGMPNN